MPKVIRNSFKKLPSQNLKLFKSTQTLIFNYAVKIDKMGNYIAKPKNGHL